MKKIIIAAMMLFSASFACAQNVVKEGNTFKSTKIKSVKDTIVTKYWWEDAKGEKYPIIINKKSGSCYYWRTSKAGKKYTSYVSEEEVILQICKEYGAEHKKRVNK